MTLEILKSELLESASHGFFTRAGGASGGVYGSLNCSYASSDKDEDVATNRRSVAESLRVAPDQLVTCKQVHGNHVETIFGPHIDKVPEADAMVTDQKGLALGVLTADCLPALFQDSKNCVIGAAHAGWQGALTGVLENTITAMERLGADRRNICVGLGPTISPDAYEVGPEFVERFNTYDPATMRFFAPGAFGHAQFDLPGFCLWRLGKVGLTKVEWIQHCTYTDSARFYSYRRSVHRGEDDYGRMISAIRL